MSNIGNANVQWLEKQLWTPQNAEEIRGYLGAPSATEVSEIQHVKAPTGGVEFSGANRILLGDLGINPSTGATIVWQQREDVGITLINTDLTEPLNDNLLAYGVAENSAGFVWTAQQVTIGGGRIEYNFDSTSAGSWFNGAIGLYQFVEVAPSDLYLYELGLTVDVSVLGGEISGNYGTVRIVVEFQNSSLSYPTFLRLISNTLQVGQSIETITIKDLSSLTFYPDPDNGLTTAVMQIAANQPLNFDGIIVWVEIDNGPSSFGNNAGNSIRLHRIVLNDMRGSSIINSGAYNAFWCLNQSTDSNDWSSNRIGWYRTAAGGDNYLFYALNPNNTGIDGAISTQRDGKWHTYTIVSNPINFGLYVDGEFIWEIGISNSITASFFYINGDSSNHSIGLKWNLKNLKIYNRALSVNEINTLHESNLAAIVNGCILDLPLDDGPRQFFDRSPNRFHAVAPSVGVTPLIPPRQFRQQVTVPGPSPTNLFGGFFQPANTIIRNIFFRRITGSSDFIIGTTAGGTQIVTSTNADEGYAVLNGETIYSAAPRHIWITVGASTTYEFIFEFEVSPI